MKTNLLTLIACILLPLLFFSKAKAQQHVGSVNEVAFTFKITERNAPDTILLVWMILPFEEGKTQQQMIPVIKTPGTTELYQKTIHFADSLTGKNIGYLYAVSEKEYDIFKSFVLEKDKTPDREDSWGYADGLQSKVKATKMLFTQPDSPEETNAFAKPYVGITTNGTPVKKLFPIRKTGYSTATIKNAVTKFTQTLTATQKAESIFPIESNEWRRWHNIESWKRAGVCLENMNAIQKALLFNLLKESLSPKGLKKVKDIMTMEAYLATLVPDNNNLGSEKYWFTFYGTPSDTEPYGWQIEGHHLVINYFVLGDQVVMTPTFMGSEPTLIEKGDHKGLRTYEAEQKKGLNFYLSLDSVQKKEATLWNKKEVDFNLSEAFRDNEIIATTGIAADKLSKTQQEALLDLIAEYVNNIREGQAKVKMADVKLHLNETHFTWIQSKDIESPFYYRIHSPVILIEFDHQTPVFLEDPSKPAGPVKTHIHTVVRTPNGNDYGKDLLREHLETSHKKTTKKND